MIRAFLPTPSPSHQSLQHNLAPPDELFVLNSRRVEALFYYAQSYTNRCNASRTSKRNEASSYAYTEIRMHDRLTEALRRMKRRKRET
jgi:hypothetical protein